MKAMKTSGEFVTIKKASDIMSMIDSVGTMKYGRTIAHQAIIELKASFWQFKRF